VLLGGLPGWREALVRCLCSDCLITLRAGGSVPPASVIPAHPGASLAFGGSPRAAGEAGAGAGPSLAEPTACPAPSRSPGRLGASCAPWASPAPGQRGVCFCWSPGLQHAGVPALQAVTGLPSQLLVSSRQLCLPLSQYPGAALPRRVIRPAQEGFPGLGTGPLGGVSRAGCLPSSAREPLRCSVAWHHSARALYGCEGKEAGSTSRAQAAPGAAELC